MLAAILLVAQPSTFARSRSQACNATEIFIEPISRLALYVSLESPSSASVLKSLPFSRRQTRFAVEHGGLSQGVPDLTTLVLFTTFSSGVVWGQTVLLKLFEGRLGGAGQGALPFG